MKIIHYSTKLVALLLTSLFTNAFYAQTYCNPSYPSGCTSTRISQVAISQVNFSNAFSAGTCISGRDRTSVIINLSPSTNYTLSVTTAGWLACGMAIDFNKDGDFGDAGEVLFSPAYYVTQNHTYAGDFMIPSSVTAGNYRMRIWNRLGNAGAGTPTADSACGTYGYGTWTDYTVNLAVLGTSEVKKTTAKAYPNPVSDVLTIEDTETIKSVEIYDFNGKLIKTESSQNSKNTSINLSDLVPGAYNAKITKEKGAQTIKFIKK